MLRSMLLAALALAGGAARRPAPGNYARSLRVAGVDRRYLIHIPRGLGASDAPLVLMLHPSGGSGRRLAASTGFDGEADRRKFIAIYPEGLDGDWNDGRDSTGPDDVAFVRLLLDSVAPGLGVRERRIYAAGISNGAMFAHRLACELPGRFAAIASVAGGIPASIATHCAEGPPTSLVAFNGTADRLVAYGGEVRSRGLLPAVESALHWAERAHCASPPTRAMEPDRVPGDGTRVRRTSWTRCDGGTAVVLYTVQGGGHSWPGAAPMRVRLLGRTTRDVNATRTLGAVFAAHGG